MTYNVISVDLNMMKDLNFSFLSEEEKFNNLTYSNLKTSYISNCENEMVKYMYNNLINKIEEISNYYNNISQWFKNYVDELNSLELYLSGNGRIGQIKDNNIRNYVSYKLPRIPSKKFYEE